MFKYKNGEFYLSEDNPSKYSDYNSDYHSDSYYENSHHSKESYENAPKIIHQTWKNKELPEKLENWRNMWLEMCPNYKHILYDDDDIENFMKSYFPQYMKDFNNFAYNIERVDFWRCAVLYVYGGVYADLDVFPMKSIDIFLEKNKVVLGREPIEHARNYNGTEFLLCNAFMISPKKDSFWLDMMEYIIKKYKYGDNPVATTGPGIMTKFYREHPEKFKNVIITEPNSFYPITFNKSKKIQEYQGKVYKNVSDYCDMKDAYVVHMWEGSWSGNLPGWGLSMIAIGTVTVILLVFLFSISISMGKSGKNKGGIKNYEITFTATTLIILGIIFLVIWLDNIENEDKENDEYEETRKELVEDIVIEKKERKKQEKTKIPRRIVQTYYSREVPERMNKAISTFKELNPDFEYVFYDDERCRKFLKENYDKKVLEAFDLLIPGAYKADLFRLCELYVNGGYYADVFMINLEPLSYFEKYDVDCILVKDREKIYPNSIYNAFLACKAKDPLIHYLIEKTVDNVLKKNIGSGPLDITGPVFLGKHFLQYLKQKDIKTGFYSYDNKKILFLEHISGGISEHINFVCDKENIIIRTKYENYYRDRPKMSHYADLYHAGKIFN